MSRLKPMTENQERCLRALAELTDPGVDHDVEAIAVTDKLYRTSTEREREQMLRRKSNSGYGHVLAGLVKRGFAAREWSGFSATWRYRITQEGAEWLASQS
jgi:hypothetical protein